MVRIAHIYWISDSWSSSSSSSSQRKRYCVSMCPVHTQIENFENFFVIFPFPFSLFPSLSYQKGSPVREASEVTRLQTVLDVYNLTPCKQRGCFPNTLTPRGRSMCREFHMGIMRRHHLDSNFAKQPLDLIFLSFRSFVQKVNMIGDP